MNIQIDPMAILLGVGLATILLSFWRAQRHPELAFDAFDLIMENGRVSKIAIAFMTVLVVTTWVIVDLQLNGNLTEGYFLAYGGMWVAPLVAKVVFNKTDLPTNTTITSMTETKISKGDQQ